MTDQDQFLNPEERLRHAVEAATDGRGLGWLGALPTAELSTAQFADRCGLNAVPPTIGRDLTALAAGGQFDVLIGGEFARVVPEA